MKKSIGVFLMFSLCFLLIGINYAGGERESAVAMNSFSLNPPGGWIVEKKSGDSVVLRLPGLKFEEVSISVAALPVTNPEAPNETWKKMRSLASYRNGVPREGEEVIAGRPWRSISYADEICGVRFRSESLMAVRGTMQCMIRFECPETRYPAMSPVFNAVKESIAFPGESRPS